jgi:phage gp36-like protein
MPSYATPADLRRYLGEDELRRVSDRVAGMVGTDDIPKIEQALDWGWAKINSYLATVYVMPLLPCIDATGAPTWPLDLVRINCELARWWLYEKKRPQDAVDDDNSDAIKDLKRYTERDRYGRLQARLICNDGTVNPTPIDPATLATFAISVQPRPMCFDRPPCTPCAPCGQTHPHPSHRNDHNDFNTRL